MRQRKPLRIIAKAILDSVEQGAPISRDRCKRSDAWRDGESCRSRSTGRYGCGFPAFCGSPTKGCYRRFGSGTGNLNVRSIGTRVTIALGSRLVGKSLRLTLAELHESRSLDGTQLRLRSECKIARVIQHASATVPFYWRYFSSAPASIRHASSIARLADLPGVVKEGSHRQEAAGRRLCRRRWSTSCMLRMETSGSLLVNRRFTRP